MSVDDPNDHRLDHIVVLMFENHSFDSLLGRLYAAEEVTGFEGTQDRPLSNPVPSYATGAGGGPVPVHSSTSMATPYPDPGEEYPHVNTQLFGSVNPDSNRFARIDGMVAPFNAPTNPPTVRPSMEGFVTDYVNAFRAEIGRLPGRSQYAQIMASYTPDQLPVLSALARGFPCFDHWFCEVPSQTYPNRSFFHAATSSGFVLNGHPPGKFALRNDALTLFNRLESAQRTWCVYIDPAQFVPATGLIHARQLDQYFATHFRTIYDFYYEARAGTLPDYAFLEPNMFHPHTDMHPHTGSRWALSLGFRPDTIGGGEHLLARVYEAIRDASSERGSNWSNTALVITFDEHGGTFDHVPPPPTVPPDTNAPEEGFRFDRLGVRVPTVLVSAWTNERTVISEPFQSTSVLRTVRDWWGLGRPLTARDALAPSFLPTLNRSRPRTPEEWPRVSLRRPGTGERFGAELFRLLQAINPPMERLERDLLGDALAHEARAARRPPAADPARVSHREAHDHFRRISNRTFPGVSNGRQY
jgi:phospholipase C